MYLPVGLSRILIRTVDTLQGRRVWQAFEELQKSQWWSRDRLSALQQEKLVLRVRAAQHSPLMAERFAAAGFDPAGFGGVDDLHRIPPLERKDIAGARDRWAVTDLAPGEALPNSTGGSTGHNVSFLVDGECWRLRDAVTLRIWDFLGLGPGARVAVVWGSPRDNRLARSLKERVRRIVDNKRLFSAYRVGGEDVQQVLDWLTRRRPDVLMGYASVLDVLARAATARGGIEGPRHIVSAAETLFPDQRERIEQGFGVPLFNLYGCREVGLVAMECGEHAGLHLTAERLVVELEDDAAGGTGPKELLVTDLDNRATPFIRYRLGDMAAAGPVAPCACGRGAARIGEVAGRTFEVIRGPSGQAVGGTFWSLLLRQAVDGIEKFQVVQHAPDALEIRYCPREGMNSDDRQLVDREVKKVLGNIAVSFTAADDLEPLPSGKHRFIVTAEQAGRPTGPAGREPTRP